MIMMFCCAMNMTESLTHTVSGCACISLGMTHHVSNQCHHYESIWQKCYWFLHSWEQLVSFIDWPKSTSLHDCCQAWQGQDSNGNCQGDQIKRWSFFACQKRELDGDYCRKDKGKDQPSSSNQGSLGKWLGFNRGAVLPACLHNALFHAVPTWLLSHWDYRYMTTMLQWWTSRTHVTTRSCIATTGKLS